MARRRTKEQVDLIVRSVGLHIEMQNCISNESFLKLQEESKAIANRLGHPFVEYDSLGGFLLGEQASGESSSMISGAHTTKYEVMNMKMEFVPKISEKVASNLDSIHWYIYRLKAKLEVLDDEQSRSYLKSVAETEEALRDLGISLGLPVHTSSDAAVKLESYVKLVVGE